MTSAIDDTVPVKGQPLAAQPMRENWVAAKEEIEALQAEVTELLQDLSTSMGDISTLQTEVAAKLPLAGGTLTGDLTLPTGSLTASSGDLHLSATNGLVIGAGSAISFQPNVAVNFGGHATFRAGLGFMEGTVPVAALMPAASPDRLQLSGAWDFTGATLTGVVSTDAQGNAVIGGSGIIATGSVFMINANSISSPVNILTNNYGLLVDGAPVGAGGGGGIAEVPTTPNSMLYGRFRQNATTATWMPALPQESPSIIGGASINGSFLNVVIAGSSSFEFNMGCYINGDVGFATGKSLTLGKVPSYGWDAATKAYVDTVATAGGNLTPASTLLVTGITTTGYADLGGSFFQYHNGATTVQANANEVTITTDFLRLNGYETYITCGSSFIVTGAPGFMNGLYAYDQISGPAIRLGAPGRCSLDFQYNGSEPAGEFIAQATTPRSLLFRTGNLFFQGAGTTAATATGNLTLTSTNSLNGNIVLNGAALGQGNIRSEYGNITLQRGGITVYGGANFYGNNFYAPQTQMGQWNTGAPYYRNMYYILFGNYNFQFNALSWPPPDAPNPVYGHGFEIGGSEPAVMTFRNTDYVNYGGHPNVSLQHTGGSVQAYCSQYGWFASVLNQYGVIGANPTILSFGGGSGGTGQFFNVYNNAFKPGGGPWDALSDRRTKSDVRDYTHGLAELLQLNPISYRYNGRGRMPETGKTHVGIAAEDAQRAMPEMVFSRRGKLDYDEEPTDILYLNCTALPYAMINALKEISRRLDALEQKLS